MDIYIRLYDIIIILQSYATCALKELITVIVASFYTGAEEVHSPARGFLDQLFLVFY